MWMHKESKWLVRGGRKVRCYLCGKKILKKDLFMFHENTGYYSHQSCMMETGSMDRNERRRAVKKIAVGAAVVGAIAAGAGKFIGVSSQSSQSGDSPAAQTILTPQGLILPALTSDPANPLPGQMWYRSDAGVTAHFDAVQNRVVYSSEINDGNVHVTSKGIVNGLSVLPNDGKGGFGPDTTKGATAPGQYGAPYTETTGIQEALNTGKNVKLTAGNFTIKTSIIINTVGQHLTGEGNSVNFSNLSANTFINVLTAGIDAIQIDGTNSNLSDLVVSDLAISFNLPLSSTGHGINCTNPVANESVFVKSYFARIGVHDCMDTAFNFVNFFNSVFESLHTYNCNGVMSISSYGDGQDVAGNSTFIDIKDGGPTSGQTNPDLNIDGSASSNNGGGVQQIVFIRLEIEIVDTVEAININNANNLTFINTDLDQYTSTVPTSCIVFDNVYQSSFINLMFGLDSNMTTGLSISSSQNIFFDNPIVLGSGSVIDFTLSNLTEHCVIFRGNFDQSLRANGGKIDASSDAAIKFVDFDDYNLTPSISTNPPVSGTAYQNTNPYDIEIDLPVYATTSGTAGYVTVAKGSTDTPTAIGNQFVNGSTSSTSVDIIRLRVPAGWYYEFTASGVTFGTASVFAD